MRGAASWSTSCSRSPYGVSFDFWHQCSKTWWVTCCGSSIPPSAFLDKTQFIPPIGSMLSSKSTAMSHAAPIVGIQLAISRNSFMPCLSLLPRLAFVVLEDAVEPVKIRNKRSRSATVLSYQITNKIYHANRAKTLHSNFRLRNLFLSLMFDGKCDYNYRLVSHYKE